MNDQKAIEQHGFTYISTSIALDGSIIYTYQHCDFMAVTIDICNDCATMFIPHDGEICKFDVTFAEVSTIKDLTLKPVSTILKWLYMEDKKKHKANRQTDL
jgi:hypothetical protein